MSQTEIEKYVASYFTQKMTNGHLSATLKDLKIDSLDLVEFVMHLEEKYGVEISADEINENGSIGQFCAIVERALRAKQQV